MQNRRDKRKGITTNHTDCIKQMDSIYTKLEENERDYNNLLLQNNTLKSIIENHEKVENIGKFLITFGFKNQDELKEFVIKYKNNDNHCKCCNCRNGIFKESIDIKSSDENVEIQNSKEEIIKNNKIMEKRIEELEKELKAKETIPTPTSSTENIKNEDIQADGILQLPNNINDIVYYRYTNDNYSYFKMKGKKYLQCCNTDYDYKEISHTNYITCSKCFRSFNLSKEADKNNLYKIFTKILPEYIIPNEEEILSKLKCNNCNNIYKKEIDLCNNCKYVNNCIPIVTELPKDNVGINTVKTFASETFNEINFNSSIYKIAKEEGIDVYTMKPLITFIKENNLLKEKQPNIIIRKIQRCRSILHIYNNDKYKNINNIIKRIYINLHYIPKLDDYQFDSFKKILINILDIELKKYEINNKKEKNEVLKNSCKNECCSDYVDVDGKYCEDCKKDLKNCKNCREEFWTDEDIKYCDNCSDSSTDDEIDND